MINTRQPATDQTKRILALLAERNTEAMSLTETEDANLVVDEIVRINMELATLTSAMQPESSVWAFFIEKRTKAQNKCDEFLNPDGDPMEGGWFVWAEWVNEIGRVHSDEPIAGPFRTQAEAILTADDLEGIVPRSELDARSAKLEAEAVAKALAKMKPIRFG